MLLNVLGHIFFPFYPLKMCQSTCQDFYTMRPKCAKVPNFTFYTFINVPNHIFMVHWGGRILLNGIRPTTPFALQLFVRVLWTDRRLRLPVNHQYVLWHINFMIFFHIKQCAIKAHFMAVLHINLCVFFTLINVKRHINLCVFQPHYWLINWSIMINISLSLSSLPLFTCKSITLHNNHIESIFHAEFKFSFIISTALMIFKLLS